MPRKGQIIRPKIKIICLYCGKEFHRFPSQSVGAKYCSLSCRSKAYMATIDQRGEKNSSWKGGKLSLICKNCGKAFLRQDYRSTNSFCSSPCWYKYNTKERITRTCRECKKDFKTTRHQVNRGYGIFCSQSCLAVSNGRLGKDRKKTLEHRRKIGLGHTGEKSYRWKGGITPENHRIRGSLNMKEWRKAVFERDDFTCQKCERRGGYLHAHHIIPFSVDKTKRFDVNNGRTLCLDCHYFIHSSLVDGVSQTMEV